VCRSISNLMRRVLAIVHRFSFPGLIAFLFAACSYDFDRFASEQRAEAFGGSASIAPATGGSAAGQFGGAEGGAPLVRGTAAVNGGMDGVGSRESLAGGAAGTGALGGTSGASASDAIAGKYTPYGGAPSPSGGNASGPTAAPGEGAGAGHTPIAEPPGASQGGRNEGGAGDGGADSIIGGEGGSPALSDCARVGGILWGGRCYFSIGAATTWIVARDACGARASHLVSITSAEEQAFVSDAFLAAGAWYWIGLSLEDMRGGPAYGCPSRPAPCDFRWTGGEPFEYQNWAVGQPNYSGGCVRLEAGGAWADTDCDLALQAICERDG
jgi:hypothetical protein